MNTEDACGVGFLLLIVVLGCRQREYGLGGRPNNETQNKDDVSDGLCVWARKAESAH